MHVHERIRVLREKADISREEFAKKIGITYAALSKYETGKRAPDYEVLQKIADYFEVSTDYLLGRTENKNYGTPIDQEFEAWLNDPRASKLYKEFNESDEERREMLFAMWEIIKSQKKK